MSRNKAPHLTPEQFRTRGHQMIDLIADYMSDIESFPVLSQVDAGEIYSSFPVHPPERSESYEKMLQDVKDIIIPGLTHWQSPNFFAYFPSNASGPSILGDMLSSGFGIQGMLWSTSPACTELETLMLDWMVEITGLPEHFHSKNSGGGVIQESASSAALCAAVAGREKALRNGHSEHSQLVGYISNQTHSSAEKSLKIAGFRDYQIRTIEVSSDFSMDPNHLLEIIRTDLSDGKKPAFVCATVGTTSSLAVDPVPQISEITNEFDIWLHVDGAYSGSATVCPEYRHLLNGIENADSYCFNPHKWLLTNFDCDLFYVKKKSDLVDALTFTPEYLRNKATESGQVFDYSGWQVSLGRRFRSLKLWFVIRHYGIEGLRAHIRSHIQYAAQFTQWIKDDDEFELFQETVLNLVCFRHKEGNAKTRQILETANASGKLFATHTVLNDQYLIRFVPGAVRTEMRHVEEAWKEFKSAAS